MKALKIIQEYLLFRLKAIDAHRIHSPFLFDLYNTAVLGTLPRHLENEFIAWKKELYSNTTDLYHEDFGAGSKVIKSHATSVAAMAKSSTKNLKEAGLISRIIDYLNPKQIIELGTSFGTTTSLISLVLPNTPIYTLEGSPQIAAWAKKRFASLPHSNITLIEGKFQDKLPQLLVELTETACVIFDGHHEKEATLRYFNQVLEKANHSSFYIFDDIRWSEGMYEAWQEIQQDPRITLSLDFFHLGIVFTNPELSKQSLMLRY
jgi:predicted O-methyltransferase YrrM